MNEPSLLNGTTNSGTMLSSLSQLSMHSEYAITAAVYRRTNDKGHDISPIKNLPIAQRPTASKGSAACCTCLLYTSPSPRD